MPVAGRRYRRNGEWGDDLTRSETTASVDQWGGDAGETRPAREKWSPCSKYYRPICLGHGRRRRWRPAGSDRPKTESRGWHATETAADYGWGVGWVSGRWWKPAPYLRHGDGNDACLSVSGAAPATSSRRGGRVVPTFRRRPRGASAATAGIGNRQRRRRRFEAVVGPTTERSADPDAISANRSDFLPESVDTGGIMAHPLHRSVARYLHGYWHGTPDPTFDSTLTPTPTPCVPGRAFLCSTRKVETPVCASYINTITSERRTSSGVG